MRRAAFVVAVLLSSREARAETGVFETGPVDTTPFDACLNVDVALIDPLPANVGGIPFFASRESVLASLHRADNSEVETELIADLRAPGNVSILRFVEPLVPGERYALRWQDGCTGLRARGFTAAIALPLPDVAGTVAGGALRSDPFKGACRDGLQIQNVYRAVTFTPSKELEALLPMARVSLMAHGTRWDFASYGFTAGWIGELSHNCPDEPRSLKVSAVLELPAGPTLHAAEAMIDVWCPLAPPCDELDAGGVADASTDDNAMGPPAKPFGCATASGSSSGIEATLVLLALTLSRRVGRRITSS